MTWFCIVSHPREEERAERNIAEQGYGVYLPRCLKLIRHAGKLVTVERPLFPRYLFAEAQPGKTWVPILSTRGVMRMLVRTDGSPTPVPPAVIDEVRALGCVDLTGRAAPVPDYTGRRVGIEVAGVPLQGLCVGAVHARVTVLLEIMGRQSRMTVPVSDVKPLDIGGGSAESTAA